MSWLLRWPTILVLRKQYKDIAKRCLEILFYSQKHQLLRINFSIYQCLFFLQMFQRFCIRCRVKRLIVRFITENVLQISVSLIYDCKNMFWWPDNLSDILIRKTWLSVVLDIEWFSLFFFYLVLLFTFVFDENNIGRNNLLAEYGYGI